MSRYRTCVNCAHGNSPCALRDEFRGRVAGLGLTSVKWKCAGKTPMYVPGQPVSVHVLDRYEDEETVCVLDGYFVGEPQKTTKVLVYVDPKKYSEAFDGSEMRNNGYMRLSRAYVQKRDGEIAAFCADCGNLTDIAGHWDWCKHHPEAANYARQMAWP